jgi:hypothetical protein
MFDARDSRQKKGGTIHRYLGLWPTSETEEMEALMRNEDETKQRYAAR